MSKELKKRGLYKATDKQIIGILEAANTLSAMRGGMDDETEKDFKYMVDRIDAFLKSNGLKRKFK